MEDTQRAKKTSDATQFERFFCAYYWLLPAACLPAGWWSCFACLACCCCLFVAVLVGFSFLPFVLRRPFGSFVARELARERRAKGPPTRVRKASVGFLPETRGNQSKNQPESVPTSGGTETVNSDENNRTLNPNLKIKLRRKTDVRRPRLTGRRFYDRSRENRARREVEVVSFSKIDLPTASTRWYQWLDRPTDRPIARSASLVVPLKANQPSHRHINERTNE